MATYTQLVSRVQDWSNRQDIDQSVIADFLDIAVKRVNNVLRIPPMETVVTYKDIVDGQTRLSIPSDLIEVIYLRVKDSVSNKTLYLFNNKIDPRSFAEQQQGGGGFRALTYTRVAGDFEVSQAFTTTGAGNLPSTSKVELYYYRLLPALNATYPETQVNCEFGSDGGTWTPANAEGAKCVGGTTSIIGNEVPNWFRDEQDDLLLYGALTELFHYLGEEADAMRWNEKYEMKLQELRKEEAKRELSGGTIITNIYGPLI